MKKLILSLLFVISVLLTFNACQQCNSPADTNCNADKRYVQYYISVIDTLGGSPYTYYAKFNTNTTLFPITQSSVFNFNFPNNSDPDSVSIRVFAKKAASYVEVVWFKEGIDFNQAHCCNDTLFKTCILNGPDRNAPAGIIPPTTTTPVPIGVVKPPQNNNP